MLYRERSISTVYMCISLSLSIIYVYIYIYAQCVCVCVRAHAQVLATLHNVCDIESIYMTYVALLRPCEALMAAQAAKADASAAPKAIYYIVHTI